VILYIKVHFNQSTFSYTQKKILCVYTYIEKVVSFPLCSKAIKVIFASVCNSSSSSGGGDVSICECERNYNFFVTLWMSFAVARITGTAILKYLNEPC